MSEQRATTDGMRRRLKAATESQIKALGGLEAAAQCTRVGKTELGYYQSLSHPERFMPIDIAADLAVAGGGCEIIAELADAVGCTCVPGSRQPTSLCADFKAFGDYAASVFRDFPALLGDARLDVRRIRQLDRDLSLVIKAAMDARSALRSLSEGAARESLPCITAEAADGPSDT